MRNFYLSLLVIILMPYTALADFDLVLTSPDIIHGRYITCTHWDQNGDCDEAIDHNRIGFYDPHLLLVTGSVDFSSTLEWRPNYEGSLELNCSFLPALHDYDSTVVPYDSPLITDYSGEDITYCVTQSTGIKNLTIKSGGYHINTIYPTEDPTCGHLAAEGSGPIEVSYTTTHDFTVYSNGEGALKVDLSDFECDNWTTIELIGSDGNETFIGSNCAELMYGGSGTLDHDLMIGNGGDNTMLDYGGIHTVIEGGEDDDTIEIKYVYEWYAEGQEGCDTIDIVRGLYAYGGESWGGFDYSEGESCDVIDCGCGLTDCTYGTHDNCFSWNLAPCDTTCN